jgi:ribosome-associated translation inhibitor RaiA
MMPVFTSFRMRYLAGKTPTLQWADREFAIDPALWIDAKKGSSGLNTLRAYVESNLEGQLPIMQIQINTDNTIESHAPLVAHIESVVTDAMLRFSEGISRVEVHLSVVNDHRQKGGEHRCLMEARMEHHPPIAASEQTSSLHQAIHGAAEKLKRAIGSTLGRIDDSARNTSDVLVTEAELEIKNPESAP